MQKGKIKTTPTASESFRNTERVFRTWITPNIHTSFEASDDAEAKEEHKMLHQFQRCHTEHGVGSRSIIQELRPVVLQKSSEVFLKGTQTLVVQRERGSSGEMWGTGGGKYLQSGWAPDEAEVENTEVSATDCWRSPYVDDSVPFSLFILCVSKTWSNFSVGEKNNNLLCNDPQETHRLAVHPPCEHCGSH